MTGGQPVILVIENSEITRKLIRVTLEGGGYSVLEAEDGRAAIDMASRHHLDLVIQDLRLPDMDGTTLVGRLRELPGIVEVPILALSGLLNAEDRSRGVYTDFTDYLFKPVAPSELLRIVRGHLRRQEQAAGPIGGGQRILLVDDDPLQRKLLALHLGAAGFQVVPASDGVAALEEARRARPDAVVSDVLMPRMDGFRLSAALRQETPLAAVPVVLVSASYVEEADRQVARSMGADALVTRTPDFREVVDTLRDVLRHGHVGGGAPPIDTAVPFYQERVLLQLDRQLQIAQGLAQRLALREAQIAFLAAAADVTVRTGDENQLVVQLLDRCLDAAGLSHGGVYLAEPDGALTLRAQVGGFGPGGLPFKDLPDGRRLVGAAFMRDEPLVLRRGQTDGAAILTTAGLVSAVLTTIFSEGSRLGVLWMASEHHDIGEDGGAFARLAAQQVGSELALSRAFARVNAAETKYRTIFEEATEGIFQTDREGRVMMANPACARMLGYESAEAFTQQGLVGASLFADAAQAAEFLRPLYEHGHVAGFEACFRGRSGHETWAIASARALRDADGGLTGYEGMLTDLSERKRADQLHEQAKARQEEIRLKNQFLSQVSHEVRSPLAVIHQFVSILRDGLSGPLMPEQLHYLEIIGRNLDQLKTLIDNLLETSRLETSRLVVTPRSTDLSALILQRRPLHRHADRPRRMTGPLASMRAAE